MDADLVPRRPEDEIGRRLREIRTAKGLSIRKLAARIEMSPSAISQIETGRSRPSVGTLLAIVQELGTSFDDLFGTGNGGGPPARREADPGTGVQEGVQRVGERRTIQLASGVTWERLNAINDHDVDFFETTYAVGGASSPIDMYLRHPGREYAVVLSGRLMVSIGFEEHELQPGDAIAFDSHTPHRAWTIGDEPAKAIWFVIGRRGLKHLRGPLAIE